MQTPQQRPADAALSAVDRLGYFMVKIRRSGADPGGDISGVVERLGSGEKREFRSCDELARVVDEWSR